MKSSLPALFRADDMKNAYATILAYGPAGAGKTYSIKTCPKPVVLATELGRTKGLITLMGTGVPAIPIDSNETLVEVIAELNKDDHVEYDGEIFSTVVLDSITQWGEYPLERYMQLKGWKELHDPVAKGAGKDPRTAYGYLSEKGRALYKLLFSLPAHLYIIAREGLLTRGEGKEAVSFGVPELPGQKLPRELPGWPDATVRLRLVNGRFKMITRAEGDSPARVRTPDNWEKLPQFCNPDIGALIRFMTGDKSALAQLKA